MSGRGSGNGETTLIVIAKRPRPGRSKTRLCPPCAPEQAARIAAAALEDTLDAVAAAEVARRVLAFDGDPEGWLRPGFDHVAQPEGGLDRRIEAAFAETDGPALLVGMDTPQLTPRLLERSAERLCDGGADAVLGLAADGGFWAVGVRSPRAGLFEGVPMSAATTGAQQLERLRSRGLDVTMLPPLRDVDTFEQAHQVARECGGGAFTATVDRISDELGFSHDEGAGAWAASR